MLSTEQRRPESWRYQPLHVTFPAHQPQLSPRSRSSGGDKTAESPGCSAHTPSSQPRGNHVLPAVAASPCPARPHLSSPRNRPRQRDRVLALQLLTLRPDDNAMLNPSSRSERRLRPHTPKPHNLLHHQPGDEHQAPAGNQKPTIYHKAPQNNCSRSSTTGPS